MTQGGRPAISTKRRVLARALRGDRLGLVRARRAGITPDRTGTVLMVYSQSSEAVVSRFVRTAEHDGWDVRLWALDEPARSLESHTIGSGPGSKYTLLNRLHATLGHENRPVVLVDDDVELVHGSLPWLAGIARRCNLDVYQPAHTYDSVVSWRLTYRRPATVARLTDFVEEGPLAVLEPTARQALMPLDESIPIAGGLDFTWRRHHPNLRFGVVDAVTFRHLRALGTSYDRRESLRALEQELARGGHTGHPKEAMRTLAAWRAWQARPDF